MDPDIVEKEQMRALKRGVSRGKNTYEDDLDELAQGLRGASSRSKIANTLYDRLIPSLNKSSIITDYENHIKRIDWYT